MSLVRTYRNLIEVPSVSRLCLVLPHQTSYRGIVERLDGVSRNSSVFIAMHGREGFTVFLRFSVLL